MSFNTQGRKTAISFTKQTALQTASVSASIQQIINTNGDFATVSYVNDTDAEDFGKGSEFSQNVFENRIDTSVSIQRRLTSEWAAWLAYYGFGGNCTSAAVGTGNGYLKYTGTPQPISAGLDQPAVTYVEQVEGGLDRALVGMVVNDFALNFDLGSTGRNTATTTVNLVGCGKVVEPSTFTMPVNGALSEHPLNPANATVSLNGTSYNGTNKSLISLAATFNNNVMLDAGYFIGSGTQNGYSIRGRMERGNREYGLTFTARLESNSPELLALKSKTQGGCTITIPGAAFAAPDGSFSHSLVLTYPKVRYTAVEVQNGSNNMVVVNVTATPLEDTTLGYPVQIEVQTVKTPSIG